MLFRAIKHQVDKGPVDAVTGKAKYTLNDNRLLREDVEYKTLVRSTPIWFKSPTHPAPPFRELCPPFILSPRLFRSSPADTECFGAGRRSEREPAAARQSAGL